jgi:hypothetical protein
MTRQDSEILADEFRSSHPYLTPVASFGQEHTRISLHAATTVVKAPEVVVRGRWDVRSDGFLGETLLLNHRGSGRSLGAQLGINRFYNHDAVLSAAYRAL